MLPELVKLEEASVFPRGYKKFFWLLFKDPPLDRV